LETKPPPEGGTQNYLPSHGADNNTSSALSEQHFNVRCFDERRKCLGELNEGVCINQNQKRLENFWSAAARAQLSPLS
jgi:hypothetical protein